MAIQHPYAAPQGQAQGLNQGQHQGFPRPLRPQQRWTHGQPKQGQQGFNTHRQYQQQHQQPQNYQLSQQQYQYNNNSNIQFYEPRRLPPPPPRKRPASLYIPPPSSYNLGISIQSPKARPVKQQKVLQPMDAPYRHLPSPPTMSRFANPYLAPIIVGLTLPPLNMETTIQENTQEKLPGLREVVGNVVWREVKWRHNAVGGGRVLVGSPRDGQSPLGSIRSPRT